LCLASEMATREPQYNAEICPSKITDLYEIGDTLGTGHFSKVKLGIHKETREKVAIKIITKPTGSKIAMLEAEVNILTACDHPNVVKLHLICDTPDTLYLVLELLTGGELFDRIIAKGHYSEADARKLTITLLDCLAYLHSKGIAHRDLKPENILLKDTSEDAVIKVTDFGLSKIFADDTHGEVIMKTACGTPGYVAPEVLTHEAYSSQVDLWSVGVIVYILLCGFPPFYGDNDAQMFKKIKAGQYKFLAPYWDPISADAKDFVAKLLVVDNKKRMTATEALKHKWLMPETAKHVSKKNLFADMGGPETKGPDSGAVSDNSAEQSETVDSMQACFVDMQLDRKMSQMDAFKKNFENSNFKFPAETVKLKKFKAYLGNTPGQLHLLSTHVCFVGGILPSSKKALIDIKEMVSCVKAKRFKLSPGSGHSIKMELKDGNNFTFTGIMQRDECWKAIADQVGIMKVNCKME